jgi:glyoxylase-like metal-dependent hydrolase (beta-lactamase superfamily II)
LAAGPNAYAATDSGVFLSRDQGASWDALNSGLPSDRIVQSLLLVGDTLVAGVYGQGVWKRSADDLTSAARAWSRASGPAFPPAAYFSGRGKMGFLRPGPGKDRRYDAIGKLRK